MPAQIKGARDQESRSGGIPPKLQIPVASLSVGMELSNGWLIVTRTSRLANQHLITAALELGAELRN